MRVTFQNACDEIVSRANQSGLRRFADWESRSDLVQAGVVEFVKGFKHEVLFSITRDAFDDVVKNTKHPLGTIKPDEENYKPGIALVENLDTPWSFMQLFHKFVEEKKHLPTWQEFKKYLNGEAKPYLVGPYMKKLHYSAANAEKRSDIRIGLLWRLGNAYYSALREIDIMISLRDAGLQMKYHLLVDALFAVDLWRGSDMVSVFIPNARYKEVGDGGRKPRPEEYLPDSIFRCRNFAIAKQRVFGKYWPVSATTVAKIAIFLVAPPTA